MVILNSVVAFDNCYLNKLDSRINVNKKFNNVAELNAFRNRAEKILSGMLCEKIKLILNYTEQ